MLVQVKPLPVDEKGSNALTVKEEFRKNLAQEYATMKSLFVDLGLAKVQ
jgi:hypothetical protein